MKLQYTEAPFLGETEIEGRPASEGKEAIEPKKQLSFGPMQTPKGFAVLNIKRGKEDKTSYTAGTKYDVEVLASSFKDTIYWRSVSATPSKTK